MPPIPLKTLASELGTDKSNLRRYIIKHGFSFLQTRSPESAGQLTLALSPQDAEAVRDLRQSQGFGNASQALPQNANGYFYIIATVPDLDTSRIKVGFATDLDARLTAHRTTSPTAMLLRFWPCKKTWEAAAIASITRTECVAIGYEVFSCNNTDTMIQRGNDFFSLMPSLGHLR